MAHARDRPTPDELQGRMPHNHTLRQLAHALSLDDDQLVALFALGGQELSADQVRAYTADPSEEGAARCPDDALLAVLDGLIADRRGPRDPSLPPPPVPDRVTNNVILKKLRVALSLHEKDLLRILDVGGAPMSSRELTTLFRKPGNKHFRRCSDEVMQAFLAGLAFVQEQAEGQPGGNG